MWQELFKSLRALIFFLILLFQNLELKVVLSVERGGGDIVLPLTFTEKKGMQPKLKYVISGYLGVLWKENYVVWIVLEPWLIICPWLVWRLINFKWARESHLHHNMAVFVPMWSRVRILHIGHTTDPPVIWPMWSGVEKGPSQLFIPNHFVSLFMQ